MENFENILIINVEEGSDKPYKYPLAFENADIILLNKVDLGGKINLNDLEDIKSEYIINTSIISGFGVDKLKEAIMKLFF